MAVVFEEAIEKVHHDVQQVVEAVVDAGDYQVGGTEGHFTFQCRGRDDHTSAGSSTSPRRMNEGG